MAYCFANNLARLDLIKTTVMRFLFLVLATKGIREPKQINGF